MAGPPLVTVVIPTFNKPALLRETMASVFQQTFTDYEVLIINDGSTDDTAERIEDLRQQYGPRLRCITQPNAGIGAARNRGLAESAGKYVALLDHDDLWMPGKLAAQVEFMNTHPQCAACSVPWAMSNAPAKCVFDVKLVRGEDGIVRRPLHRLSTGQAIMISSAIMVDREKVAGLGYETRPLCMEDTSFQIQLFSRGEFGVAGDEILMVYRVHATNYSHQAAFFANGIRLLRELNTRGQFTGFSKAESKDLIDYLAHVGRTAAVRQLLEGTRLKAAQTYLREWLHQLAAGRIKFLASFPILLLLPENILRRKWTTAPPRAAH